MVMAEQLVVRIGNYDVIRTIGKGNFASVKLARHRVTKTEVAIKIIEKFRLDPSDLNKIYREIQILKLLRHPHIIKLYEVIETKSKIHLVCEYASHGEVFDYITQEEKIPEDKARKMFYQVLTAIEYCHKHNVVHRDLKAENLLLDGNDNIKLADFGFGNFFQSGQNLNTWCGSPPYAAPEVFEGKLYEGPQLDIWSLGIVLYVLVCGTFPFDGSNLASLKERVLAGRFRIPYWMSQECENLIRRMLVVNPKKRLTIAQIKKHKWLEPVAVKPETSFRKCDSPSRRSGSGQLPEFNEHILNVIQSLGIDRQKTLESLRKSSYDYLYAIYHLLVDRLKHHRTSVPIETKFSYDGGKRRPSNIAEQSIAKNTLSSSATSKAHDPFRFGHKLQFYTRPHKPVHATSSDATPTSSSVDEASDVTMKSRDVQFVDDAANNEMLTMQRSLAFGALQIPLISQPPLSPSAVSKPKYITQPCRGNLPHQPWSFNAGLGIPPTYVKNSPHPLASGLPQRGSGDVIPSVTSIDEGVEMRSASPNELEMIKFGGRQPMRYDHGIPNSHHPLANLITKSGELAFQANATMNGSQADSMYSSSSVGTYQDRDKLCGSLEIPYDSAPKVVLSPCVEETDQSETEQQSHVSYVEKQRQLLDVSPTGFREGRRASDGLLLLGDSRIGEQLKRLTRATHFPPISQEETEDNGLDCSDTQREASRQAFMQFNQENRPNELGTMSSHSSHHVMQTQRDDVINFQPYASTNRRCSLQVAQYLAEERCSSYSKGFETPLVRQKAVTYQPAQVIQHSGQSCEQPDDDHLYQWSSWKTVTEKDLPNNENLQQRRDTIPLLNQSNMRTFSARSDDTMSRSSSVEQTVRHSPAQSMAQRLQRRRINRKIHIAQHTNQQPAPSYTVQLPEFELLRIVDGNLTGSGSFPGAGAVEELSGVYTHHGVITHMNNIGGYEGYSGGSLDLQQNLPVENREQINLETHPPGAFLPPTSANLAMWADHSTSPSLFNNVTTMEYSS